MKRKVYLILLAFVLLVSNNLFSQTYHDLSIGSFTQDWTNTGLLTVNNDWTSVPSIIGYRGDNLAATTGVDPQTLIGDSMRVINVTVDQTSPNTVTSGGICEFEITNPVVAFQGSGTADAPFLVFFLNSTGVTNVQFACNLLDIDGAIDNSIQPIAFQYRIGTTGDFTNLPAAFVADASSGPSLATLVTPVSFTLPAACDNQAQLQIRVITANAVGSDEFIGIDDIVISGTSGTNPALTATPNTLTGFTYVTGTGPSVSQSYDLSGTNLTGSGNIVVTASTNYEVSLDDITYSAVVNVPYTGATLAAVSVYVRLIAGLPIAAYNLETITNVGGGANVDVTCSGDVTTLPAPTLMATPNMLPGFTYIAGSGPSTSQSFDLTGTNLTGAPGTITVTPPAPFDYEVSLDDITFTSSVDVAYTSSTLAATTVYIRLASGLIVGSYNSQIAVSGGGATAIDVTCNGAVTDPSTTACLSEDFSGFSAGSHAVPTTTDLSPTLDTYTLTPGWTGSKIYSAGGEIKMGTSSAVGYIITNTVDLSAGDALLSFDMQQYGTDAGLVQVSHAPDGVTFTQVGSDFTPTAGYTTESILITGGTAISKIKIGTTLKRVYLDNVSVTCDFVVTTNDITTESISVYPNPVNNMLMVSNISTQNSEVRLFDITGNLISVFATDNQSSLSIDLSSLQSGIYLLNIMDGNSTSSVHKIVKM